MNLPIEVIGGRTLGLPHNINAEVDENTTIGLIKQRIGAMFDINPNAIVIFDKELGELSNKFVPMYNGRKLRLMLVVERR